MSLRASLAGDAATSLELAKTWFDDAVAQMLGAWPALETLHLGEGSRVELAQLLAAARTRGALRDLGCEVIVRAGAPLSDARGR
jgi:hypothetical protein